MAHRERAIGRLERRIPGECVRRTSRVAEAIVSRARRIHRFEPREYYGEALLVRSDPIEKPAKTIETEPNSPLLIRLVRDPYVLETTCMVRKRFRDVEPTVGRRADPFPRVMSEWDKVRFKGFTGNPVRNLGIGPQPRVSPTAYHLSDSSVGRRRCR
jgi:hypothetical protein